MFNGIATLLMSAAVIVIAARFPVDTDMSPFVGNELLRRARYRLMSLAAVFIVVGILEIVFH